MTQYFNIFSSRKANNDDPYKQFTWYEDDNGYEKYGYLYSASVSGCLVQMKEYIDTEENDFEITINASDEQGGSCVITNNQELEAAKLKYKQIIS